jgi:protoheme IX farnesyltransferase
MKMATTICAEVPAVALEAPPKWRAGSVSDRSPPVADAPGSPAFARLRAADYLELTKPRVAVLVLVTVAVGVLLAAGRSVDLLLLFHAVAGTALVAAGASALNQLLERHRDARMARTENRPLPTGRLQPVEVLLFGVVLAVAGIAYLALLLPTITAAVVAAVTFVGYVAVYTPLKPVTTLNTLVGAIPGALPPVIGWTAVRGEVGPEALALFAIVFLWQLPHFLAIAWIYRDDYARAGYRMVPVADPDGTQTAQRMAAYCLLLIPASLLPVFLGPAHVPYVAGAVVLGLGFLARALAFGSQRTDRHARKVLRASLLYLPALFALLLLDRVLF